MLSSKPTALTSKRLAIYGLASIVSVSVSRQDGPLVAVIVCLVVSVLGGYGPSLKTVEEWHLDWFWRMCPGVSHTKSSLGMTILMAYVRRHGLVKPTLTGPCDESAIFTTSKPQLKLLDSSWGGTASI